MRDGSVRANRPLAVAALLMLCVGAYSKEQLGLVVPMHDGVRLAADLFLPEGGGRWPTVLVRTPYGRKSPASQSYRYFVRRGYALVIEDVRGRYASQGRFGDMAQEGPDSDDTIDWIAEQPWSNGRVAMAGGSYLGMVQWWAALEENPHLAAISPVCSGDDEYSDRYYSTGGALKLGHRLLWLAENLTPPSRVPALLPSYIRHLPVRTSDIAATGLPQPLWRAAIEHPSFDDYWKRISVRERIERVQIPTLSFGGWFDNYAESDLDAFSRLALRHKTIETWIGPWAHNPNFRFVTRDFGLQARLGIRALEADWFDKWMKKVPLTPSGPLLHIFVMGPDIWREEHEWPLARTRYTPLYLESGGRANSSAGDGMLRWQPVIRSKTDTFTYDPRDPVPTMGGSICCEPRILPPGPLDQTTVEARKDVLVYTSAPLAEDLEVTGAVRTILYVATSANDTDFTAKIVDVDRHGRPLSVTDGLQRLRYRLSLDKPIFVKQNQAYQISVNMGVTSYVFAAGHRIRLEVSSSNFPRFDRNMNTTAPNAKQGKPVTARQTVFHEKGYPSAIILPVIGKTRLTSASRR
jgi:putative CocE/NonD family hydrolase